MIDLNDLQGTVIYPTHQSQGYVSTQGQGLYKEKARGTKDTVLLEIVGSQLCALIISKSKHIVGLRQSGIHLDKIRGICKGQIGTQTHHGIPDPYV